MTTLIEPNLHPVLVHFAYALTITATLAYLLSARSHWSETLKNAADWMLAFAALAIVATIAAGFQAYYSVGHDGPSHAAMTSHRNWAVPSGIAILVLAVWRWTARAKAPAILFKAAMIAAALSLSVTAWWGGHIVYNYGLGVKSLPSITGDGHDHEHGADEPGETELEHDNSDGHHDDVPTPQPETVLDREYPKSADGVVDAFHAAMKAGDMVQLKSYLHPDVFVAEGGGAERSLAEYESHHMPADMAFKQAVSSSLKNRQIIAGETVTTIISESQTHGTYKDKKVHSRMMETMVLRRDEGIWKIVHIHWSSAEITGDHEH
jgi:uncharacterized membrane protein/ketosteroid isomerase-like protein